MASTKAAFDEAGQLDKKFKTFRDRFCFPTLKSLGYADSEEPIVYLCGNSLGLMPKATQASVDKELCAWANLAVVGHHERPDGGHRWIDCEIPVNKLLAKIVGAKETEVALTGTLTGNLNNLLTAFYKPDGKRYKLLFEAKAFPSDNYAFQNQVRLKGYDPEDALIPLAPRKGEYTLRTEDILEVIEKQGEEIAVVIFSGIQYYTGQFFDIPKITSAGHAKGCIVGWDLAHATGNVPLSLHDWGVDFAVMCSYKYLNSGPGNLGALFVHEKMCDDRPRPAGWWGHDAATRFEMEYKFTPSHTAQSFCNSTLSFFGPACLMPSLQIFEEAGFMPKIREHSLSLTSFFYRLLQESPFYNKPKGFTIITPADPAQRGAQISILFLGDNMMCKVFDGLMARGIIGDERKPDVLRLAPAPLYNTHHDVVVAVNALDELLGALQ